MEEEFPEAGETIDWYLLTPVERFQEFLKLWEVYILLGGDLGPEPDSQSPFCFFETWCNPKKPSGTRIGP